MSFTLVTVRWGAKRLLSGDGGFRRRGDGASLAGRTGKRTKRSDVLDGLAMPAESSDRELSAAGAEALARAGIAAEIHDGVCQRRVILVGHVQSRAALLDELPRQAVDSHHDWCAAGHELEHLRGQDGLEDLRLAQE